MPVKIVNVHLNVESSTVAWATNSEIKVTHLPPANSQ